MKLALGTVQFGLDYGVANQNGQITIKEASKILEYAKKKNIETLDTASLYGNSETILGKIGVKDYQVITKTIPLRKSVDEVLDNFYKSLENLGINHVEGLLIHDVNDIKNKDFDQLLSKLQALKNEGLIDKIGFSTYTPEQIDFLLANFEFDLIQVPLNVFDTRLIEGGQLRALKDNGVEVHSRSVFLQGLLVNFHNLPEYFLPWQRRFNEYQLMVSESNLSLLEYAVNFVLNIHEIDKVLVGVNSELQLKEIVRAVKGCSNLEAFSIYDLTLIDPSLWKT